MKNHYLLIGILGLCSILISSCDEIDKIFNPSSDYLIEKNVKPNLDEQKIESGSEFKIIFPANSISGNLEVKVKKESTAPEMNIPNLKAGKNFFKIKFSGTANFLKPVQLIINYDKTKIPAGKTASETIKGYIYANGNWKLGNFVLDEPNGKIIFSISNIFGKINKDEPILLDDGEIIIGDGYTTTDIGQSDNPLAANNYFGFHLISTIVFNDGNTDDDVQWDFEYYTNGPKITWNGNNFSFRKAKIDPKDWIKDYETKPDSTIEVGSGIVSANGEKIIQFTYEYYNVERTYYDAERPPDLKIVKRTFKLENLVLFIPDLIQFPSAFPFQEITGPEIAKNISNLSIYYYFYSWDPIDMHDDITERKSVSFNWNGSYSRLGVYFRKL